MRINEFHWIKIWPFPKIHLNQHFGFSLDNPAQRPPLIVFELKLQRFSLQVTIFWLDNGLVFTWQSCQATCLWHLAPSVPGPKEPEKLLIVQLWSYGFFIVQLWSNAFLLLSNSDLMLIKPALLVPRRRLQARAVCAGSAGCPASPADFNHDDDDVVVENLSSFLIISSHLFYRAPLLCRVASPLPSSI